MIVQMPWWGFALWGIGSAALGLCVGLGFLVHYVRKNWGQ